MVFGGFVGHSTQRQDLILGLEAMDTDSPSPRPHRRADRASSSPGEREFIGQHRGHAGLLQCYGSVPARVRGLRLRELFLPTALRRGAGPC